jgi:glycine oxidase
MEPVWVIQRGARLERPPRNAKPTVAIIGAGVIGLGIAWRLAARGMSVAVFDKGAAGAGASHAAAGMLAACAEAEPGEDALVTLGRESQARWPAFAAELEQASGIDVGLRPEGTLVLALTADDQARLNHQLVFQQKLGLPLQWITAAETRRREPHLAGKLAGAVFSPEDTQVDNRKLAAALRIAAEAAGASITEHRPVSAVSSHAGRIEASFSPTGPGRPMWSCLRPARGRATLPAAAELQPPVRRSGQMLITWMRQRLLTHVVWAPGAYRAAAGRPPAGRRDRRKRLRHVADSGRHLTLLEAAGGRCPRSRNWRSMRCGWGIDRAPGRRADPRAGRSRGWSATGHHRNGILLTPITADAIARLVLNGVARRIRPFGIERFGSVRAALRNGENAMAAAANIRSTVRTSNSSRDAVGIAGGRRSTPASAGSQWRSMAPSSRRLCAAAPATVSRLSAPVRAVEVIADADP